MVLKNMSTQLQDDELWVSTVYKALIRPPMFAGITLDYACLIGSSVMCLWLLAGSFSYLLTYIPMHMIGWIACKFDPNILNVYYKSLSILPTGNKNIWGCDSYEPW